MHLNKAVRGARALQEELEELKRQNTELKQRLEHVEHPDQPKRGRKGGPTLVALQGTIRELNSRIRDLEKARRKDKKKIDKARRDRLQFLLYVDGDYISYAYEKPKQTLLSCRTMLSWTSGTQPTQ